MVLFRETPMPQITLEYTDNIKVTGSFNLLFSEIHQRINQTLGINPLNIKSRVIVLNNYYIADGTPAHAFAHLQIKILDGHKSDKIVKLGEAVFKTLEGFFQDQVNGLAFQPSVEISEMKRELYFKFPVEKINLKSNPK